MELRAEGLSREQIEAWGRAVGADAARPLVLALSGPLGAGKSVLARAIARGAGVTGAMPSPTFNLVYRYEPGDDLEVWHLDLYRLEDPEEVWELGWRELGEGNQIVLVEWPERAAAFMPAQRWELELTIESDPDRRTLVARPVGAVPDLPRVEHVLARANAQPE